MINKKTQEILQNARFQTERTDCPVRWMKTDSNQGTLLKFQNTEKKKGRFYSLSERERGREKSALDFS